VICHLGTVLLLGGGGCNTKGGEQDAWMLLTRKPETIDYLVDLNIDGR